MSMNKPAIEGVKSANPTGRIIISGSVKFDGNERKHYYAFTTATIEEVKKSIKDAENSGPTALEIVPEIVVYVNMRKAESEKVTGFESVNLGMHLTPGAFENSMWECARGYFQKYDFAERKRRIAETGISIDTILRRINRIPYEIEQARKVEDYDNANILEDALIHIGRIVGCPKTACDLAAVINNTDMTLLKLCPGIPMRDFEDGGTLHARRLYEERFLEIRRTPEYAKIHAALVNAHVERITALIKGEYQVYSAKGEEISKLFSMIPRISDSFEEEYREPPKFEPEDK